MMGWNEIVGHNVNDYSDGEINSINVKLAPNTLVHFWKGELILINEALEKGYDVVNSFHEATYLDYGYDYITMEKAYNFDPIPKGLKSKYQSKIKGLGCQMWSEWIPTVESMNEMVFPKITAYAEVGWTAASNKNYKQFTKSLPFFYARWEKEGINYYR
jgi:hexosaminidase